MLKAGATFNEELKRTTDPLMVDLFRCINLCHDVTKLVNKDGSSEWNGASLDEICFVEMAAKSGFCQYKDRD